MGELWETRVQSVASQQEAPSLFDRSPLSFSISVSLLADNHRRLHADRILRPQMIWENMPRECSCAHLNSAQLCSSARTVCVYFSGTVCGFGCVCVCVCVCVFYLHVVFGVAPVPLGVQVAQAELLLLAEVDLCHRTADLTRHKV